MTLRSSARGSTQLLAPSWEKGKRPYWLLKVLTKGYQAPTGELKSAVGAIHAGWWVVDGYWYICTSDGQVVPRK